MKIHGTTKGGALSKKDFGVAFGGGAVVEVCQTSQSWDDNSTQAAAALYAGVPRTIWGAIILDGSDFIDQNLKTATFYIKKTGTPAGTISCKLYSAAVLDSALSSVIETSSNSVSMETGWSDGDHEFTFSGNNDIAENNALVLFCTFTSSDSENYITGVRKNYDDPNPTERMRQYQKEAAHAVWEGQANMNPRFKVCNY